MGRRNLLLQCRQQLVEIPPTRPPPSTEFRLQVFRLRRNEFIAGRHELVGVELLSFERACDSTILFEHRDRLFPILLRHPSERLAGGVGRHPRIERQLRLPSRDRRHRRFGEFLDDDSELIGMRTPIKEASEARGDKGPDDLGIVLDERSV